jgi:hypothetical protein
VGFGLVHKIALAHVVVCRRRDLSSNQISTIANGTFARLTALQSLYDAGLSVVFLFLLAAWCLHGSEALRGLFQACLSYH